MMRLTSALSELLRRPAALVALLSVLTALGACGRDSASEKPPAPPVLRIAADSSIADAVQEMVPAFHRLLHEVVVDIRSAPTMELIKEIRDGVPTDLIVSADPRLMRALVADGLVTPEAIVPVGGNSLVLIQPPTTPYFLRSTEEIADPKVRSMVIGDPDVLPSGRYARQWLEELGLWDDLEARTELVQSDDAILARILSEEADAALVFASDARKVDGDVRVVGLLRIPGRIYEAAPIARSAMPQTARTFIEVLAGDGFRNRLYHSGFLTAPDDLR